jgi:sigma-E factor negative regulatory protein RseA
MNTTHSSHSLSDDEALSAWADGELSPEESASLMDSWDSDPQVRSAWHRHHWLGDALRSQDLAVHDVAHDLAFVQQWRARLDADTQQASVSKIQQKRLVVPSQSTKSRAPHSDQARQSFWGMAWAAALAGVMVSGVFWMTQRSSSDSAAVMVRLPAPASTALVDAASALVHRSQNESSVAMLPSTLSVERVAASQAVLRDPRLDAYLLAHNPFGRGATLAPSITRVQAAASVGQ